MMRRRNVRARVAAQFQADAYQILIRGSNFACARHSPQPERDAARDSDEAACGSSTIVKGMASAI
jgi:hypothetical protein